MKTETQIIERIAFLEQERREAQEVVDRVKVPQPSLLSLGKTLARNVVNTIDEELTILNWVLGK